MHMGGAPALTGQGAVQNQGIALVVDDELSNRVILKALLKRLGYQVAEAKDGEQAVAVFQELGPDVVFMDVMMPGIDGYEATDRIKKLTGERFVPVIFLTALTDEDSLVRCIEAGGDDFLTKPFSHTILRSKIRALERIRSLHAEVNRLYERMRQEEEIAEQVFSTAVVADNVAMDVIPHVLQPADIFSGDLLLTARAPSGDLHVLLGDFTGHGLSAALGALPTAEVFRTMTAKGFSPEQILSAINRKLHHLLPTGMFLAATFVCVPTSLEWVKVGNCGLPESLILDGGDSRILRRLPSRGLPLGIIPDQDLNVCFEHINIQPGTHVLLASDGVTEAHGQDGSLFGQERFEAAIAASAGGSTALKCIIDALQRFCGDTPQADDISLVELICDPSLFPVTEEVGDPLEGESWQSDASAQFESEWQVSLTLNGSRLCKMDPVPLLINQVQELEGTIMDNRSLFTVLTELYVNALDHGVLELDSSLKSDHEGFADYFVQREKRLESLAQGSVNFEIQGIRVGGHKALRIRVEDSGQGFDHADHDTAEVSDPLRLHGRGLPLLRSLCVSLEHQGAGNVAEAIYRLADAG